MSPLYTKLCGNATDFSLFYAERKENKNQYRYAEPCCGQSAPLWKGKLNQQGKQYTEHGLKELSGKIKGKIRSWCGCDGLHRDAQATEGQHGGAEDETQSHILHRSQCAATIGQFQKPHQCNAEILFQKPSEPSI